MPLDCDVVGIAVDQRIDQVIICTGNRYAFLLHIVQPHKAVVVFRVTLCDLINPLYQT